MWRAVTPAWRDPERRSLITFFLIAAAAIPVFYLPALFFDGSTHYTIADTWRFWIIHLWVEGFFELFVTVVVAIIFYQLGLVERTTALRVISVMTNATVGTITQAPQGNVIKVSYKGTESEYTLILFKPRPKGVVSCLAQEENHECDAQHAEDAHHRRMPVIGGKVTSAAASGVSTSISR